MKVTVERYGDVAHVIIPLQEAYFLERIDRTGIPLPEFDPRLEEFIRLGDSGEMLTYVLWNDKKEAKGYCNVYLTSDMLNKQLVALEDTIYIDPDYRGGRGKILGYCILGDLRNRGVKRFLISVLEHSGVEEACREAGFRDVATQMMYTF